MAIYRVGDEGATVFNAEGKAVARLRSGYVVVPGTLDTAKQRLDTAAKRLKGYADKAIRPAEDKAPRPTPSRRADPRLSNCVLEGGRSKAYPETDR